MKQQRQTFEQLMEQLARRHGVQAVFSDFLTLLMCAFSHGQREDEYLNIIRKYEKPEAYRLSEALGALVIEMTGDGSGMVDVLGDIFRTAPELWEKRTVLYPTTHLRHDGPNNEPGETP